jgi:tRNA (guanine26-N2/guanine27-N2)-dimethyltransferase
MFKIIKPITTLTLGRRRTNNNILSNFINKRMSTSTSSKSGQFDKIENATPPEGFDLISEGTAYTIHKVENEVFYNKVQVINRDLSTLVIKMFDEVRRKEHEERWNKKRVNNPQAVTPEIQNIRILEALSATGLRAIRYWKEIPNLDHIIANDLLPEAVEAIKRNVEFNNIDENCVRANLGDAMEVLYTHRSHEKQFHVVDLDPYGSASIFLDGAVQAVADGGLLCVTCTDMLVLAGKQATTCFSKYGAYPLKIKACHEQALRILLGTIQNSASRYKRHIEPLISLSIDFYVRVFVRVRVAPEAAKNVNSEYSQVVHCVDCDALHFEAIGKVQKKQPYHSHTKLGTNCSECGGILKVGGPIWTAPIHNVPFIEKCLEHLAKNEEKFNTVKRMTGFLTACAREVPDAPLYYDYGNLSSKLKSSSPPIVKVRSALMNAGYQVSQTHAHANGMKTNAPIHVIYDVFRTWVKDHPSKAAGTDTVAGRLIAKEVTTQISFEERKEAKLSSKHTKVPIFLPNPEENWGPGTRAGKKRKQDKTTDEAPAPKQQKVENSNADAMEE